MTENTPRQPSPRECGQCGKPAIGEVGSVPLCVDHYTAVQASHTNQLRHLMAMLDFHEREMASITGIPWLANRVHLPSLPPAPLTVNSISIKNSNVGAVNTGTVHDIEVALNQLDNAGSAAATSALKAFAEALIADPNVPDDVKNEMLQQLALLGSEATAAAKDRKPGLIKPTLAALTQTASQIATLGAAWQTLAPILHTLFG